MDRQEKRRALFDAARELFLEHGFKNTNISGITNKAEVAVGTFYTYFDSKEQIFCEVYDAENERNKRQIVAQIDRSQPPKVVVRQFLDAVRRTCSHNKILAEWYTNSPISQLLARKYAHDDKHHFFAYSFLVDQIKHWRETGQFRHDISLETMLALFHTLIVIDNHKDEVGIGHYPDILELLAEFVTDGLSK